VTQGSSGRRLAEVLSQWEPVIGLEVHAQLLTRSKMFCGCRADYAGLPPNSNTCPTCLGLPGALPVANAAAIRMTVRTGLALQSRIPEHSKFDRKNYFYPDLPKGYQISQYDLPLCVGGWLEFDVGGTERAARITRVHLEEDAGKLLHAGEIQRAGFSLVDLNRAGVPLMEVVGEPDLRSPAEARAYLVALRQLLVYLGVNDGNMEEGSLRCDANISLRRPGEESLGVRAEVKNLNSFRILQRALEHEVVRQAALLESGATLTPETRGWSEAEAATVPQRGKEEAEDYRYFPDPDLPPIRCDPDEVAAIRSELPELPRARALRLRQQHNLSFDEARGLTERPGEADHFEQLVAAGAPPATAAAWQLNELAGLCQRAHRSIETSGLDLGQLARLLLLVQRREVSAATAKTVLAQALETGADPVGLVEAGGLRQLSDEGELTDRVGQAIAARPQAARDFLAGNDRALSALVGHVMAATRGRADARRVDELLRERLTREGGG